MPQFTTRDGRSVEFSSRRDPITPVAHAVGVWVASRWLPILVAIVNLVLLVTSRWGALVTVVAAYVVLRVLRHVLWALAREAASWSVKLGQIDRYRSQSQRLALVDQEPVRVVGDKVRR